VIATADDLLALADILKVYEFGEEDRTPGDDGAPPAFDVVPIPSREDFEASFGDDLWEYGPDDLPESHTAADEAALLGYELVRDGLVPFATDPDAADLGRDRSPRHRWAFIKGMCHGRVDRESKVAREARERAAQQALLECYGAGQAAGWGGAERLVPRGMTAEQGRQFLDGFDAGEAVRLEDMMTRYREQEAAPISDRDVFGPRLVAAIREDAEDRDEWSFA
jgi:hypothetical protein